MFYRECSTTHNHNPLAMGTPFPPTNRAHNIGTRQPGRGEKKIKSDYYGTHSECFSFVFSAATFLKLRRKGGKNGGGGDGRYKKLKVFFMISFKRMKNFPSLRNLIADTSRIRILSALRHTLLQQPH